FTLGGDVGQSFGVRNRCLVILDDNILGLCGSVSGIVLESPGDGSIFRSGEGKVRRSGNGCLSTVVGGGRWCDVVFGDFALGGDVGQAFIVGNRALTVFRNDGDGSHQVVGVFFGSEVERASQWM